MTEGWFGGGVSKQTLESKTAHRYPDKGVYDFVDTETGESLITEENRKDMNKDVHSYRILEETSWG